MEFFHQEKDHKLRTCIPEALQEKLSRQFELFNRQQNQAAALRTRLLNYRRNGQQSASPVGDEGITDDADAAWGASGGHDHGER